MTGTRIVALRRDGVWAHAGQPGNIAASLPDASHPEDKSPIEDGPAEPAAEVVLTETPALPVRLVGNPHSN